MNQKPRLRPLHLVNELANETGQEITYAYDDLAFISHSEVLVQFTDDDEDSLHFFTHQELDETTHSARRAKYEIAAQKLGIKLSYKGRFSMKSKEGAEEIDLRFYPEA
jgi:hypothetical protein